MHSSILRLWLRLTLMLVICGNIPVLNITWPGMILPLVLAWYIITELGSILENAIKLGAPPCMAYENPGGVPEDRGGGR